jgi:hypothetical protein
MRQRDLPKYIIKDSKVTGCGMKVVVHYRTKGGQTLDWVCDYDRLDHIIEVCYAKGLDVVGVEQL